MPCSFVIHTGNLNEMEKSGIYTPQAESENKYSHSNDTKTTLKIFLSSIRPKYVESAFKAVLDSINESFISTLIIDFPKDECDSLEDDEWLKRVRPIWSVLEDLVDEGKVLALGAADLGVDRLRLLVESTERHPPKVNHFSIDGCCTVPPELVEYAKSHDIQLLTHNDARIRTDDDATLKQTVQSITKSDLTNYERIWTAR
ncbi:hypothetical protein WR25_23330 [Diploscapter pachys]|uniref:GCS light chain n=1 Tax=Diploscapter pachys TaxID=2018661 RepID=A0A2A2LKP9_9BILA|nr:hypothetical protein WR25_23330 [Diploscapter pachys]